jgi:hypothetical protein
VFSVDSSLSQDIVRPLGGGEEMFWLLDHKSPTHICFVAEVQGQIAVDSLRKAIDDVQKRHPLLSVSIDPSFNRVPHFRRAVGNPIPLRVAEGAKWQKEVEDELRAHFESSKAPLCRVVFIPHNETSFIILSAHHSITDGISLAWVTHDILASLSGQQLKPLADSPCLEELAGFPTRTSSETGVRNYSYSSAGEAAVYVQSSELSPELTRQLRERARKENTSVHGILSAAFTIAARKLNPQWDEEIFRCLSPVDIRKALGLEDQCQQAFATGQFDIDPHAPMNIWEMARTIRSGLIPLKTLDGARPAIEGIHRLMSPNFDVENFYQIASKIFNAQAMISNIGIIPYDSAFGNLRLVAVWGPALLRGIQDEQSLGVATINGAIHLLHSTRNPMPELLNHIESKLVEACNASYIVDQTTRS